MQWGRVVAGVASPWTGGPEDPVAWFDDWDEDEAGDEEEEEVDLPFGALRLRHGCIGASGPGVGLQIPIDALLHSTSGLAVEVRLRDDGRYVRSALGELADKDRDLTLRLDLHPGDQRGAYLVSGFLPYAALPGRIGSRLALEAWLTEDGEPVEEQLWRLSLPPATERLVANALGAVTLAAVAASENACRPLTGGSGGPGLLPARHARLVAEVTALFELDAAGSAVVEALARARGLGSVDDAAKRLRAWVAPEALPRVVALLDVLAGTPTPGEARFLAALKERLGVRGDPKRRTRPRPELARFYDTLGLTPGADWDAIRAAYRTVARVHHPDRVGETAQAEATERMKGINAAYAALRKAHVEK